MRRWTDRDSIYIRSMLSASIKVTGAALSYAVFASISNTLSIDQFGAFGSLFSASVILSFVILCGQNMAAMRFWPGHDNAFGREVANRSLVTMALITARMAGLVLSMAALANWSGLRLSFLGGEPRAVLLLALLASAFAAGELVSAILRAKERVISALVPRDILWRLLLIVLTIFVQPETANQALMLAAVLLLSITAIQAGPLASLVLDRPHHQSHAEARARREILAATPGLGLSGLLSPISEHLSTVIVAAVVGPVAAAGYFAADRLSRLLSVPLFGANHVVSPRIARLWRRGDISGSLRVLGQGCLISGLPAVVGFVLFVFLGELALSVFGPLYADAFEVLLVLSAASVANGFFGPNVAFAAMTGMERPLAMSQAFAVVAQIALLIVLGTTYGVLGVAYGQAAAVVFRNLAISLVIVHGVRRGSRVQLDIRQRKTAVS